MPCSQQHQHKCAGQEMLGIRVNEYRDVEFGSDLALPVAKPDVLQQVDRNRQCIEGSGWQ